MAFGGLWLAAGLIFLPVGLALLWHDYERQNLIPAEGARTVGMVLTKTVVASSGRDERYSIEFRFSTKQGKRIQADAKVTGAQWNLLRERGPVKVGYLPDNPDISRVPGQIRDTVPALLFSSLGGVFAALGAVIFTIGVRGAHRVRVLTRSGTTAQARVDGVAQSNFAVNGVPQLSVHYSFKDASGRVVHGKSEAMSPEQANQWKPGDRGTVRFDAAEPRNSVWIGKEQA
jgi:hypothetical protein